MRPGISRVGSTLEGRLAVVPLEPVHTSSSQMLKSAAKRFRAMPTMMGLARIFMVKKAMSRAHSTPTPMTPRRPTQALPEMALK